MLARGLQDMRAERMSIKGQPGSWTPQSVPNHLAGAVDHFQSDITGAPFSAVDILLCVCPDIRTCRRLHLRKSFIVIEAEPYPRDGSTVDGTGRIDVRRNSTTMK